MCGVSISSAFLCCSCLNCASVRSMNTLLSNWHSAESVLQHRSFICIGFDLTLSSTPHTARPLTSCDNIGILCWTTSFIMIDVREFMQWIFEMASPPASTTDYDLSKTSYTVFKNCLSVYMSVCLYVCLCTIESCFHLSISFIAGHCGRCLEIGFGCSWHPFSVAWHLCVWEISYWHCRCFGDYFWLINLVFVTCTLVKINFFLFLVSNWTQKKRCTVFQCLPCMFRV